MSDTDDTVEPLGVGSVRAIRTFRIGDDGGLYPVNTATMWTPGWNVASCARGRAHTPPDPDCRCGFYVYFHPEYTLDQPPARQVLAVVEVRGVMEVGTRGARVPEARIVGLWLGPKVSDELADLVAGRYRDVRVFRDRDELLAQFPLTPVEGTRGPRLSAPTRTLLRRALWTYAVVATVIGLVPSDYLTGSPAGATLLLTTLSVAFLLLVGGLVVRTPMIACVGVVHPRLAVHRQPALGGGTGLPGTRAGDGSVGRRGVAPRRSTGPGGARRPRPVRRPAVVVPPRRRPLRSASLDSKNLSPRGPRPRGDTAFGAVRHAAKPTPQPSPTDPPAAAQRGPLPALQAG